MLPYPLITLAVVIMWLLLNGISPGQVVLGVLVGVFSSWALASLRPDKPKFAKWYLLPKLFAYVVWDILLSNLEVGAAILRGGRGKHPPGFVTVPVATESGIILSVMAIIVTCTPGSAWLEYDYNRKTVLIHVFSLESAAKWAESFKNRYERLLLEIFA